LSMERRTGKGILASVLIVLFVLVTFDMPSAFANPVSTTFFDEGRSGGSPATSSICDEVYFSNESVFADIENTSAKVLAHYTFRNTGDSDVLLPIFLPFHQRSWDIEISQGEVRIGYIWQDIEDYIEDIEGLLDDEGMAWLLFSTDWISFNISVPAGSSSVVTAKYMSKVSVHSPGLGQYHRIFSYLVGSARLWNHSLDHAFFEFRMPVSLFNEGWDDSSSMVWERKEMDGYCIFTQEFYDWVPDSDYIWLSWDIDNSYEPPSKPFFYSHLFWAIALVVQAFIVSVILLVHFLRMKKRAARLNRMK